MKTYKELITELRSHPELNPHKSLVDNLEPYLNDPDMFITYTQDLGSKKGGSGVKVGINPHSAYNTPIGVYTYPIKEAWKMYGNSKTGKLRVPFAGENPTVVLLKRKGKHVDDIGVSYSSSDWDKDMAKLRDYFVNRWSKILTVDDDSLDVKHLISLAFNAIKEMSMKTSRSKTIGGQFWNFTRILSVRDHIVMNATNKEITVTNNGLKFYNIGIGFSVSPSELKGKYNKADNTVPDKIKNYDFGMVEKSNVKSITLWNQIFRMLGYESIADRSGNGIIHDAEPMQAVFFSSKGYSVVGSFDNVGKKDAFDVKIGGTWDGDIWKGGAWSGGTWKKGIWKNGQWNNGIWKDGDWYDGTWKDGTWEKGDWLGGTWKNGTWKKGYWEFGKWENGTWQNGSWEEGTWINGTWKKGEWGRGTWYNGTFEKGNWYGGTWKSGIWKGGTWHSGVWEAGKWLGGKWKGGKDKDGNYHPAGDSPDKW